MINNSFVKKCWYAGQGLWYVVTHETSAQIEGVIFLLIIGLAWYYELSYFRFLILIIVWIIVLVAEVYNTALERLLDITEPRLSAPAGLVKNMLAGAVLLCAAAAGIISLALFLV